MVIYIRLGAGGRGAIVRSDGSKISLRGKANIGFLRQRNPFKILARHIDG